MAKLRTMFEDLGFTGVRTLLQSGNVVFEGKEQQPGMIEKLLEDESSRRFGLAVDYLVRSSKELAGIVANNPFEEFAKDDPGHLIVLFLKADAPRDAETALQATLKGRE